jgi:ATP-dependent helicase/DNAse subunit B
MTPELRLLIGPAGAGKSRQAWIALQRPRSGRAMLLRPQGGRILAQRTGVHQFYSLACLLLRRANLPYALAGDTLRRRLLRRLLRQLAAAGELPILGAAVLRPGFVLLIDELISDLRAADLDPAALATAGVTRYDDEVATILRAYIAAMATIEHEDLNGLLVRARTALREDPGLLAGLELLVVDGFDQFTPLQLSLLLDVLQCVERALITLGGEAEERPAQHRFNRTRRQLEAALDAIGCTPQIEFLLPPEMRAPALARIERRIFELEKVEPLAGDDAVQLIEAPDREREVRAVLRRVKRLLAEGVESRQIGILMRDDSGYAPLLHEVAAEYELPLHIHAGRPLAEAPAMAAALALLRLPLEDFPRRALVESWRAIADWADPPVEALSPELPDLAAAAALLERIGRENGIAVGMPRLQQAVRLTAAADPPTNDEWDGALVTPAAAAALLPLLERFAGWLKPPARGTVGQYVAWLSGLLANSAGWLDGALNGGPGFAGSLPAHAWNVWQRLLQELTQAAEVLKEEPQDYADFFSDLAALVASRRYCDAAGDSERVAALPVLAARGRVFEHVLLLGLAEGDFPQRLPDPPLYSRRERALLARRGLPIGNRDPGDERSLFYDAVTSARLSLTLAYTRLDAGANELPASPYLKSLLELVTLEASARRKIAAGAAPQPAEAASTVEQLLALFSSNAKATAADAPGHLAGLAAHVRQVCDIEQYREGEAAHDIHEGRINDPTLQAELATIFGPEHRWSVSQFNDYITCPFRFKAAHLLRLEVRAEPEAGLDRSRRGRLYHSILAAAGRVWAGAQPLLEAGDGEHFLAALREAAEQVLRDAPQQQGFEPGPFWHWEQADIQRRLEQAMRRALENAGAWAAFHPAACERSFGMRRGDPPLRLETSIGPVQVLGRIDRIDQRKADQALAVIDYKSSSSPRALDESLNGRDVQLPIYMLAAQNMVDQQQPVERAAFLHLGSGRFSKALTGAEREQAIEAMKQRVAEVVEGARSGDFAVRPRDKCPTGCSFADICRLNLQKQH